jgi:hypothetical protein
VTFIDPSQASSGASYLDELMSNNDLLAGSGETVDGV